jgi:hypothetical protein
MISSVVPCMTNFVYNRGNCTAVFSLTVNVPSRLDYLLHFLPSFHVSLQILGRGSRLIGHKGASNADVGYAKFTGSCTCFSTCPCHFGGTSFSHSDGGSDTPHWVCRNVCLASSPVLGKVLIYR